MRVPTLAVCKVSRRSPTVCPPPIGTTAMATTHITMVIAMAIGTIGAGTRPIGVVTPSGPTTTIGMRHTMVTTIITIRRITPRIVPEAPEVIRVAVIGSTM